MRPKKRFALLLLLSLALAAPPPFPERAAGGGLGQSGVLVVATSDLPWQPLGLDAGLSLYLGPAAGELDLGLLVFPGLAVGHAFGEVGAYAALSYVADKEGFSPGVALGPRVGIELADPLPLALYAQAGIGYLRGLRLSYGAGARAYLGERFALEAGLDDVLGAYAALLYLW